VAKGEGVDAVVGFVFCAAVVEEASDESALFVLATGLAIGGLGNVLNLRVDQLPELDRQIAQLCICSQYQSHPVHSLPGIPRNYLPLVLGPLRGNQHPPSMLSVSVASPPMLLPSDFLALAA